MSTYNIGFLGKILTILQLRKKVFFLQFLYLRVCTKKIVFLFLIQNICCGYSKEPKTYLQTDGLENIYNFTLKNFVYLNLWLK